VITVYAQGDAVPQIPTSRLLPSNVTIQFVPLYGLSHQELDQAVAWTSAAAQAGALTPLPTSRFTLNRIVDAHLAVRGRSRWQDSGLPERSPKVRRRRRPLKSSRPGRHVAGSSMPLPGGARPNVGAASTRHPIHH